MITDKTTTPNTKNLKRDWHHIDASGMILGKVATEIAKLLIGKHKTNYVPHANMGDMVVVTNASKVQVTGKKMKDKVYHRYTGYPSGIRSEKLEDLMKRRPTEAIRRAVKGMLPKNKLTKERMSNLYIYQGNEHPHQAHFK